MKKTMLLVLTVVFVFVTGVVFSHSVQKVPIPEDAEKVSDLVPSMGEHWANPQDLPLGPIYLVHDGEVVGMEFMFTVDMMKEIDMSSPEGKMTFKHIPELPVNAWVDHVDLEFMSDGHEGFEVPHFDVHLYFVTPDIRQKTLAAHDH